jgi:hypothetical protein
MGSRQKEEGFLLYTFGSRGPAVRAGALRHGNGLLRGSEAGGGT